MNFNTTLQANIQFLSQFKPKLANSIKSSVSYSIVEQDYIVVEFKGKKYSFSQERAQSDFQAFQTKPSKISFLRTHSMKKPPASAALTSELFDKHNNSLVEALPNLSIPRRVQAGLSSPVVSDGVSENMVRDYMFLGSLNFIPFSKRLVTGKEDYQSASSWTLVESSLPALVALNHVAPSLS